MHSPIQRWMTLISLHLLFAPVCLYWIMRKRNESRRTWRRTARHLCLTDEHYRNSKWEVRLDIGRRWIRNVSEIRCEELVAGQSDVFVQDKEQVRIERRKKGTQTWNILLFSGYESVIGLEVHAQLLTKSKLFSGAPNDRKAPANTAVSLFDAAIPGTLPVSREMIL